MNGVSISKTIIGNFVIAWLVGTHCYAATPRVELVVRDTQTRADVPGTQHKQIAVGVSYTLEVAIHDVQGEIDNVTIDGLEGAVVHKQGVTRRVNSFNGVANTIITYRYSIRFDHKGSYLIGPAHVFASGQELVSDKKTILVSKTPPQPVNNETKSVQVQLLADKKSLVVGETTTFRIRFFPGESSSSLSYITPPELTAFTYDELKGPVSGSVDVKGAAIPFMEWQTQLTAKEVGSQIIPAVVAEYRMPRKYGSLLDDDILGGLFSMGAMHKKVSSNPLEIEVLALPVTQPPIQAVGLFHQLTAKLEQTAAIEHEGIVLTLSLEGQENVAGVAAPQLVMPDGIRCYESKSQLQKTSSSSVVQKKVFEYVLQGDAAGTFTIPAQIFTYFDTKKRQVATLQTQPMELLVLRNKQKAAPVSSPISPSAVTPTKKITIPVMHHEIASRSVAAMPWVLFYLLVLLPLFTIAGIIAYRHPLTYVPWYYDRYQKKIAYRSAHQSLKHIRTTEQFDHIYRTFVQLFAARTGQEPGAISAESMITLLKDRAADDNLVYAFEKFIAQCADSTFGHKQHLSRQETVALLHEAELWLAKLQKIV